MTHSTKPLFVAILAVALGAYVFDCEAATTPEQAMQCCKSMHCSSHGHLAKRYKVEAQKDSASAQELLAKQVERGLGRRATEMTDHVVGNRQQVGFQQGVYA